MPKTIAITPSWYWPESVDRVVGVPPFSVTELCVARHARENPDAIALISNGEQVSYGELMHAIAIVSDGLLEKVTSSRRAVLSSELSISGIIRLLGGLAAGCHIRIAGNDETLETAASSFGSTMDLSSEPIPPKSTDLISAHRPSMQEISNAAVAIPGRRAVVNHSQRSLLAGTISLVTFLQSGSDRPWLASMPLSRWDGLLSVLVPLYLGVSVVVCASGDGEAIAESITQFQPGCAIADIDIAAEATRESKRAVKKARSILDSFLLTTAGVFDPGDRQRVEKSFRCPSLTMFGLAETGTIFASHPQWYLDESVGIPMTNAHVVPSDPRNGAPIQALWELVESAEVTVKGPMLMCGYEGGDNENHFINGRFRTGVIASSDANGMIYILPD